MLGLKLIHVSKRGQRKNVNYLCNSNNQKIIEKTNIFYVIRNEFEKGLNELPIHVNSLYAEFILDNIKYVQWLNIKICLMISH